MITNAKLNIKYILDHLTQEEIMERYTGIVVNNYTLAGNSVRSPFRADPNPTCNFYYTDKGKLRFRDWSGPNKSIYHDADVFDVAGLHYKLNSRIPSHFNMIINFIARDFKIHNYSDFDRSRVLTERLHTVYTEHIKKLSTPNVYKVIPRKPNKYDIEYWSNFNISIELLKKGFVYCVKEIYKINDDGTFKQFYTYNVSNPCYGYYNGKNEDKIGIWKFYYPFAKKPYPRFTQNIPAYFGEHLVTGSRIGLITKAYKDVLSILSFEEDIDCMSLVAEGTFPDKDKMFRFLRYHDINFVLLDFDLTGIRMANKIRKEYPVIVLFLTNGRFGTKDYGAKDISDYIKIHGRYKAHQLILEVLDYYREDLEYIEQQNYNLLKWISL